MKTQIEFTRAPIVPPPQKFSSRETGASVDFFGVVRELENGKPIAGLFYEAHEAMARRQLEKILAELSKKFAYNNILFIHRLDFVPVGEASLFIRAQSRHRAESLQMISELIDRLKADVPIWKLD